MSSVTVTERCKSFTVETYYELYLINAEDHMTCLLPAIVVNGDKYKIKRIDENSKLEVIIVPHKEDTINKLPEMAISPGQVMEFISYNHDWIII
jgi:hypothetical protein